MKAPIHLRRQTVLYSLPLLLVLSHFQKPAKFFLSIPFSIIALLVPSTKLRMYASNVMFILFLMYPDVYFACYGFTVASVYKSVSNLCFDTFKKDNLKICIVIESVGMVFSIYSLNSRFVSLLFTILQFVNIYYLIPPPIESTNYGRAYERIVKLLKGSSFTDRANEYKSVICNKNVEEHQIKLDFLTPLFMSEMSLNSKTIVCCSSLVFNKKMYWLGFIVYSLFLLSRESCGVIFSFFCDFIPGHPTYRIISAQILYLVTK